MRLVLSGFGLVLLLVVFMCCDVLADDNAGGAVGGASRLDGGFGDYIDDARLYEEGGNFGLAFEKIYLCASRTGNRNCYVELVGFVERRVSALPELRSDGMTSFTPMEISMRDYWDYVKALSIGAGAGSAAIAGYGGYVAGAAGAGVAAAGSAVGLAPGVVAGPVIYVWMRDRLHVSAEEANKVITEAKSDADLRFKMCDDIKQYIYRASELYMQYLLDARFDVKMADNMDRLKCAKARVKAYRANYVSYSIVSPCLALTSQLIFMSKKKGWVFADEDLLREAAGVMALGASEGNIRESHSDVRMQFIKVYGEFKDSAGKALFEECKVIQSVSDKINNDAVGESAWWP